MADDARKAGRISTMQCVYTDFRARNFRLFADVTVQFSPVTIVSGRNNTGKTALLEAVFLHACGPRAGAAALSVLGPARSVLPVNLAQSEGQSVWDSLFRSGEPREPITLTTADMEMVLAVTPDGGSSPILSASTGETRTQSLDITTKVGGATKKYTQTVTQQYSSTQTTGPFSFQLQGVNGRLDPPGEPYTTASIIMSRTRSNQVEIAQRYSDLRVLGRQGDLLNAIKEVEPRLEGLEVLVKDGLPLLHLSLAGHVQPQPLSLFGEGMVAAIDIMSLIYARQSRVVLLDEVENGIHYTVLSRLWWHIKRAARATGTQVIATTHSRECIAAAQQSFEKDGSADLRLLRLWRKSLQSEVSVTSYDFSDIGNALDQGLDLR